MFLNKAIAKKASSDVGINNASLDDFADEDDIEKILYSRFFRRRCVFLRESTWESLETSEKRTDKAKHTRTSLK